MKIHVLEFFFLFIRISFGNRSVIYSSIYRKKRYFICLRFHKINDANYVNYDIYLIYFANDNNISVILSWIKVDVRKIGLKLSETFV